MQNITLRICHLTEYEKQEICAWKYDGEYAVYNLPVYEVMKEKKIAFMNPEREVDYMAYYYNDIFIGYTNIREKEKGVFIGIGVKPDMCGRGYGQLIMKEACRICKDLYPDKLPYLEVRTWNERAIRCYRKSGFEIVGDPFELELPKEKVRFYRMEYCEKEK